MEPEPFLYISSILFAGIVSAVDYIFLALILLLTLVNTVVAGSEIAFFSLTQNQISTLHTNTDKRAIKISNLLKIPEKLSGTIFIASNFFNIVIAALFLYLLLARFNFGNSIGGIVAAIIITIVYLALFVETLPKRYASYQPFQFVKTYCGLMEVIIFLFSPFSSLLVKTTHVFSRHSIEKKYDISLEDLSTALELTSDETTHEKEKDMLEGIIRFRDKMVEDILVSRSDMVAIDIETPFSEVISFIVSAGFSRIPVYQENPDNIKGILYVKDLLPHLDKIDNFRWQSLIRPAYFVPGAKRIDDLLEEFRANKNHMAIIVDEYGGTSGIVTMEDILEEIIGDISDEYDEEESPTHIKMQDGSYIFEARTPIEDFIDIVSLPEKEFEKISDEADTLAGLILELKGDFPKPKEVVEWRGYKFKIEEMDDRRIIRVKYIPKKSNLTSFDA